MSASTGRHERENAAKLAAALGISRETFRKIKGQYQQQALQDAGIPTAQAEPERVGLYVKISPALRDRLAARAREMEITQAELLSGILSQYLGNRE